MVGWTRRNRESAERRRRWFASLTEEQRQAVLEHEAEFDRKLLRGLGIACIFFALLFLIEVVFR